MKLFLAPHNDDEALFGAYTIMREKPLVLICTDGYIQREKGLDVTPEERREETVAAMNILTSWLKLGFLGIPDSKLTVEALETELKFWITQEPEVVYAPAVEGYAKQHDLVGYVAENLWPGKVIHYMTYTDKDLHTKGKTVIIPTPEEIEKKNKALDCYVSQLRYNKPHFDAVRGQPEYYE